MFTAARNHSQRGRLRLAPSRASATSRAVAPPELKGLRDLDEKWRARLQRDDCPPLLGLVPLSQEECATIGAGIELEMRSAAPFAAHPVDGISRLLRRYPAAVAVWLSRLAGEAYDAGNFWDEFAAQLRCTDVPVNRRESFANEFRRACRQVMGQFFEPQVGSFRFVGEFLFQAGLPICHCRSFAAAMRAAAEAFGALPEADDAAALEDFRDEMLRRAEVRTVPVVKTALAARSGLFLLAAAVRVVREDAFSAINPQLGERLRESFEKAGSLVRGAAVRPPWLRLEDDLTSLAIVGPRQPAASLGSAGVRWAVGGVTQRVGVDDEFIFPIAGQERLAVELLGLAGGRTLQREFALHPGVEQSPAWVFAGETRRRLRVAIEKVATLEAGDYWVVHPAEYTLDAATETHAWWGGVAAGALPLATSRLELRPGSVATLTDGWGEALCEFRPAAKPFLDLPGGRFANATGALLHYGWAALPRVWVPVDAAEEAWELRAQFADAPEKAWPLRRDDAATADGVLVPLTAAGALSDLRPALHRVRLALARRGRVLLQRELFLWQGLEEVAPDGFRLSAPPGNLVAAETRGFAREGNWLRHEDDALRQHTLAFRCGDASFTFAWPQPGVFLQSFEKVPGRPAEFRDHAAGETFSADTASRRWLRVTLTPPEDAELLVGGQSVAVFANGSARHSIDLSLAQCAATRPGGGQIVLRRGGVETVLAGFAQPLTPCKARFGTDAEHVSLACRFREPIGGVRLRFRELISGRDGRHPGSAFPGSGHLIVREPDCPPAECININHSSAADSYPFSIHLPKEGWPAGIWIVEADICRDELLGWQPLADERGRRLPLVVVQLPDSAPTEAECGYRALCLWNFFWNAARIDKPASPSAEGHEAELAVLLGEVRGLLAAKLQAYSWQQLKPLEELYKWLIRQASWLLRNRRDAALPPLAEQLAADAGLDDTHALLVWLPDLLAQPASAFAALPASDPLRGALRWAAVLQTSAAAPRELPTVTFGAAFGVGAPSAAAPVLRHFAPGAARSAALPLERWFKETTAAAMGMDAACEDAEALSPAHLAWSTHAFLNRVREMARNSWLEQAGIVFHAADRYCRALRQKLPQWQRVLGGCPSACPWMPVEIPGAAFESAAIRFASVYALALRSVAAGWLSFPDATAPLWNLQEQHGNKPLVRAAITTLTTQAPELFGFHLMLWELLIRTHPHD